MGRTLAGQSETVVSKLQLSNICLLVWLLSGRTAAYSNIFLARRVREIAAARRRLTDELVLHSLQQRLVGIFGLHGSGALPRQHGAYQMLSAACGRTMKRIVWDPDYWVNALFCKLARILMPKWCPGMCWKVVWCKIPQANIRDLNGC